MVNQDMYKLGSAQSLIRMLFEYGKQRAAVVGAENIFDFSLGNPSVLPPAIVNETAKKILDEQCGQIHAYTSAQGDAQCRADFAASLSRRFGEDYCGDNLYITVGAAAALTTTLRGLCCEGDEFVVLAPYFPEYSVFITSCGGKMVKVMPNLSDFQLDLDAIKDAITPNTKAILVNSPNNPSGVVYTADSLTALSALLTQKAEEYGHPIYLISDEPYREIVFQGYQVPWIPHLYRDTIVCYSFSKSLSLPGERIGYVLVPDQVTDSKEVYAAVAGAGRAMGYVNAPSLFQRVTAACCELTADLSVYEKNASIFVPALRALGYEVIQPQGAFYLFIKSPEADDMAFMERAKSFDILLVPGSGFGVAGYARIAFCVQTERVERSIPQFKALMESYH